MVGINEERNSFSVQRCKLLSSILEGILAFQPLTYANALKVVPTKEHLAMTLNKQDRTGQ
jgi:uncharacterized protein (DUF697 family)